MILGTGIDIIEVERIRASHEKFGKRFTSRILLAAEIDTACGTRIPRRFWPRVRRQGGGLQGVRHWHCAKLAGSISRWPSTTLVNLTSFCMGKG
ncbi:MAG: hypothetical protein CM1200mP29_02570 [Verrucomicrobiota bacterium]|nr:MAG: hypothetical protein CM1200mP29_02570 [Verrucomicrobiota bacterium]